MEEVDKEEISYGCNFYDRYVSKNKNLRIARSTIPEVNGLGLFAVADPDADLSKPVFKNGDFVCLYKGKVTTDRKSNKASLYLMQVWSDSDVIIDSDDPLSCLGRYLNTLTNKQKVKYGYDFNVECMEPEFHCKIKYLEISACKDIYDGEEMFLEYGDNYYV